MKPNKKIVFPILVVLAGVLAVLCFSLSRVPSSDGQPVMIETAGAQRSTLRQEPVRSLPQAGKSTAEEVLAAVDKDGSEELPLTEEEKAEAAAEAKVEAFDNLTDKWMEPSKQGVSMKDIEGFTAAFRAVPKDRKDECIHRALNLIPDENVMLLAGVLMDKSEDKEIVETVFNDVLNRDEEVKKPILREIFKDKTHPCWADTAWIFDVTGELPAKK